MYIGKVFIGSRFLEWDIVFDTANSWTVISDTYDVAASSTSQALNVYDAVGNLTQKIATVHLQ